jgi:SAM-dependent methyltransferase
VAAVRPRLEAIARRALSPQRRRRLRRPARLGTLRRTTPISDAWGRDRGTPVDRHYIEGFLAEHRGDIRGDVLELLSAGYTDRFGRGVTRPEVLDIDAANPRATLVADLTRPGDLPAAAYDCFILTQTLQFVYDLDAAVASCHRVLRPGGSLLLTVPAVSRISRRELDCEYWRFTVASVERLLGERFGDGNVEVRSHGSVLTGVSFLMGLAAEELSAAELAATDPYFPVLISARAVKAATPTTPGPARDR